MRRHRFGDRDFAKAMPLPFPGITARSAAGATTGGLAGPAPRARGGPARGVRRPGPGLGAEEADREAGLGEAALAVRRYPVPGAVGPVGDHGVEAVVDVVRAHPVVAREAAREGAIGDEPLVERAALRLGVVMRAEAAGQHAKAVGVGAQPGAEGIGGPALEPADAPG